MKLQNFFSSMIVLGVCTLMLVGSSFLVVKSVQSTYAGIQPSVNVEMESTQDLSNLNQEDVDSAS